MSKYQIHPKEFLVGATIGSLLGSVTALLIAPKSGSSLRHDLCDTYCSLSDKTCNVANQLAGKTKSLSEHFGHQSSATDWSGKAKNLINSLMGSAQEITEEHCEENEECCTKDLATGAIVGALVGAAIGFLVAPKPGKKLVRDLAHTYEDISDRTQDFAHDISKKGKAFARTANKQANKWVEIAKQVANELSDTEQGFKDNLVNQAKSLFNDKRINEVIDWASLGYRVWNGLNSKR